jgi:hypothetical protein
MTWIKRDVGSFFTFDEPGDVLEGEWLGTAPGKYGDNGQIKCVDGEVKSFSLTTVLEDLRQEKLGARLRIVYAGMVASVNGHEYKAFDIYDFVP